MSQVPAITSETELNKAPEQNRSRQNDFDFDLMLEKEKQKISFPYPFSILQSLFNSSFTFSHDMDESVNKIESKPQVSNDPDQKSSNVGHADEAPAIKNETINTTLFTDAPAKKVQANNIQFTGNAINRLFVGELELSPEFYNMLISTKNKVASLRNVDIDDLVSQIQDKIRFLKENGKIELSIQLRPDSLGSILMSVSSNKGLISINIYADKIAREALEENLKDLEISLKQVHLNIGSLNVFPDEKRKNNRGELAELLYNN